MMSAIMCKSNSHGVTHQVMAKRCLVISHGCINNSVEAYESFDIYANVYKGGPQAKKSLCAG